MVHITSVVGRICPRCQYPIQEGTPVKICSSCHTPHHEECWDHFQLCSVRDCGNTTSEPVQTAGGETKTCPYCGETIKAVAILCKHCHSKLESSPEKVKQSASSLDEGPTRGPDYVLGESLVRSSFNYGWKCFTENLGLILGSHITVIMLGGVANMLAERWSWGFRYRYYYANSPMMLLFSLLSIFLTVWLTIGLLKINLKIVDRRPVAYQDLFTGADRFWPFFGESLLTGIAVGVAGMFLIIPGIVLAIYWIFSGFVVVDQGKGAIASIGESFRLVKGSFWSVAGFLVLAVILNIVGALLFGLGLFVTIPVTSLSLTYLYRRLQMSVR